MTLQQYVKQVSPRNESYVNHVDKIQSLLNESSKSDRYEKDVADSLKKINPFK